MEWNEESIERLRALWAEGHSTAEIGRRMNISKNAVVGKAHRLNLTARPSPIRRDGPAVPRAAAPRRVTGSTLPPLPATQAAAEPAARLAAPRPAPLRPVARPASPIAPMAKAAPVLRSIAPPRLGRATACCWPIGEPGTKSFRFCDSNASHGKPYCAEHAQIAYVKVRDRREDAA